MNRIGKIVLYVLGGLVILAIVIPKPMGYRGGLDGGVTTFYNCLGYTFSYGRVPEEPIPDGGSGLFCIGVPYPKNFSDHSETPEELKETSDDANNVATEAYPLVLVDNLPGITTYISESNNDKNQTYRIDYPNDFQLNRKINHFEISKDGCTLSEEPGRGLNPEGVVNETRERLGDADVMTIEYESSDEVNSARFIIFGGPVGKTTWTFLGRTNDEVCASNLRQIIGSSTFNINKL